MKILFVEFFLLRDCVSIAAAILCLVAIIYSALTFPKSRRVLAAAFAVCVFWTAIASAGKHVESGNSFFYEGNYTSALAEYNKAAESEPKDAMAYLGRARVRFLAEQDEMALADVVKAIELNHDFAPAYELRSWLRCATKDYEDALADIDKAIALQPEDATLYISRGEIYREKGDSARGFADIEKGMKSPRAQAKINEISFFNRMLIHGDKESKEKEFARYCQILEINPEAVRALRNRAGIYAEQENFEAAIADYTKLIELNPDEPDYYELRAYCYHLLGRIEEEAADNDSARALWTQIHERTNQ